MGLDPPPSVFSQLEIQKMIKLLLGKQIFASKNARFDSKCLVCVYGTKGGGLEASQGGTPYTQGHLEQKSGSGK